MDAELVAGMVVAERFRLERELGKGGMGAVWAATHMITNKMVALKFMHVKSVEMTARFVREAQTASAVRHPNVVEIHDVIPLPDGTPLMVMEMLSGEALADKLAREGRLSPIDTAQIMAPVISAVMAAHAAGIVHRDLKPENIFLARYSHSANMLPKVLDFGIAKLVAHNTGGQNESALTRTGSVLGTPYYMSPEQVFGEKDVDTRADIWALGVILYQCLCGQRPFEGENFGQLLKAVTSGQFEPIENLAPWVPPHVRDVMVRMLRDRQTRLADLGEVEHALLSVMGSASTRSLPFPSQPGSGAFVAASGHFSGGYPIAQGSGALPQGSGGFSAARTTGGQHGAPPMALTPPAMVRSQTLQMAPTVDDLPLQSSMGAKIGLAVAGLALISGGVVYAVRQHSTPPTTRVVVAATSPVAPTTSAPVVLPILSANNPTPQPLASKDAGGVAASLKSAAPHPSATGSSRSDSTRTGGTGGLSTAVPF